MSKILKNPEACRTCAACCKAFPFYDNNEEGFVDRIRLLKTDKITVEETDFADMDGKRLFRIVINIPCSALEEKDGKYYCRLYGKKERPEMCGKYPFEVTDWERKHCKGLANLSCGKKSVRFRPPLTFSREDADKAVNILKECL